MQAAPLKGNARLVPGIFLLFRFPTALSTVIAGLDPAIHERARGNLES
jgi:hypothetical protein